MYGDCQLISSMVGGGGGNPSESSLFSSNPSFTNFINMSSMAFNPFPPPNIIPKEETGVAMRTCLSGGGRKEEILSMSGSGSEQMEDKSGNELEINDDTLLDDDPNSQPTKKKRYHRHTARQIQEMEALFKECPHPDDKQRLKLSQDLGLKPRQVKFWFQNRRTQMKAQQDRSDNAILRAENDALKHDNYRLQAALHNLICPNCGGPAILGDYSVDDHQLRLDNARLKDELEHVCSIAKRYTGRPIQTLGAPPPMLPPSLELDMNIYSRHFPDPIPDCPDMIPVPMIQHEAHNFPEIGLVLMEDEKNMAMDVAISSMDELLKMCNASEPLWTRNNETGQEVLNLEEHARTFSWSLDNLKQQSSQFRIEATRDTAYVIMNSITLVDAFLDAGKWMELFPSIVSRARTIQVIASSVSGHASGSLHLMYAELQVLSPLVPTREAHFLRYCQQNVEEGSWSIVDFPIDTFQDTLEHSFPRYKRRPSGCLIQDMPNGYSKVTWVEHAEVEEKPVHPIFTRSVYGGAAFGAHRWLAVLQRQCQRVASLMARNISDLGVIPSPEARKNMMRLSQRMIRTFCANTSTSGGQSWTALSESPEDTVRITTRKITEPGQPNGMILGAVSTTWVRYPHNHVFDLLRDDHCRALLDVISNGNSLHEIAHIANGSHPGNCISLLRINVASNSSQHVELILQESCTDDSGSMIVYSSIDVDSIQLAMSGEDPSCIPLLPQGFVTVPSHASHQNPPKEQDNEEETNGQETDNNINDPNAATSPPGSLLTVGLQVLASTIPSAKINLSSVTAINNHLCNTVNQIGSALAGNTASAASSCLENGATGQQPN